jgi:hypothetical protein
LQLNKDKARTVTNLCIIYNTNHLNIYHDKLRYRPRKHTAYKRTSKLARRRIAA